MLSKLASADGGEETVAEIEVKLCGMSNIVKPEDDTGESLEKIAQHFLSSPSVSQPLLARPRVTVSSVPITDPPTPQVVTTATWGRAGPGINGDTAVARRSGSPLALLTTATALGLVGFRLQRELRSTQCDSEGVATQEGSWGYSWPDCPLPPDA